MLLAIFFISAIFPLMSKTKIVDTVYVRQNINGYLYEFTNIYNNYGNLIEYWIIIYKDNQFVNGFKNVINRNSKEIATQILNYGLIDNKWYLYGRYTYSYDINDLLIEELNEIRKNNEWVPNKRIFYIYNSKNLKESEYSQSWDGEGWVNVSRKTYSYNGKDSVTKLLSENIVSNTWTYDYQISKTFDDNGNLLEYKYEKWKDWKLIDYWKSNYTYNSKNLIETYTFERLVKESKMPIFKFEYFYDQKSNLIKQIEYYWKDVEWIGKEKITFVYDNNSLITNTFHEKIWNGDWTQYKRFSYNYDDNKKITSILEESFGTQWNIKTKEIFEYDNFGNEVRWRKQEIFNDELFDKYLIKKDYDQDNFLSEFVSLQFDFDTMKWDSVNSPKKIVIKDSAGEHQYYGYFLKAKYKEISTTSVQDIGKINVNQYTTNEYIQETNDGNKDYIRIYDLQGRLVKFVNFKGETIENIQIDDLPRGIYFIQIGSKTQKFIKQ